MNHIVITGASSGIGAALAIHYATNGVHLYLSARNASRLDAVAQTCRAQGAIVETKTLDVMDRRAMTDWLCHLDDATPLDLVIANAGISSGSNNDADWEETTRDIFAVNLAGVLNTILPLIPRMIKRKRGQIALMSSLAGFRGLSSAPAYSASKVAVKAYGEALRLRYGSQGLKVSVICPGFVKSRITAQNDFTMPFLMEAPKAAALIAKGLRKNKALITFPFPLSFPTRLFAALPLWVLERISRFLPSKE